VALFLPKDDPVQTIFHQQLLTPRSDGIGMGICGDETVITI